MLSEKDKVLLSFMCKLRGQLAMLKLDYSSENKDQLISIINDYISEGLNVYNDDNDMFCFLEAVRLLRNLKEYDAAIILGEKLERLPENGDGASSENTIADLVTFENAVTHLERYRVEYHQQRGKDFCKYFLVRVQEVFNKFDDVSRNRLSCQRDAYFIMLGQSHFLCHQVDDKEISSQLCSNAIKYVERYLETMWSLDRNCFTCHQKGTATEVQLVCSGCRVACYCSLDHQRMSWKKGAFIGMRIGHKILCPLWKAYRNWKLASKEGNDRATKYRRRLDRECLYFLSHGLGLKHKFFEEKDVYKFY